MLPKTNPYVKIYNGETKLITFLIKNGDLLKIYIGIWKKARKVSKNNLIANPSTIKNF